MKNLISVGCLLFFSTLLVHSQSAEYEKEFNKAEKIFNDVYEQDSKKPVTSYKGAYTEALPLFMKLYAQDSSNMNIAYKIGVCHLDSKLNRKQAIPYLKKASQSVTEEYRGSSVKEKNAPVLVFLRLGDAYHLTYKFDSAIAAYEEFIIRTEKNNSKEAKTQRAQAQRKIEMCNNGITLMKTPANAVIKNMGGNVNSPYADYAPVLSADRSKLFFTSRRPETTGSDKDEDGNYMEDIFMAERTGNSWSPAVNIGEPINSEFHEAAVGISPDGQTIIIYKDELGEGNLYTTTLQGDKWKVPELLNDNINTKHWEPSAFISADGNTLYFTSDRPGGHGGRDLYISRREAGGDWGPAENMGPNINTAWDEDAPFIHPDGISLIFSSNGHNTMGGFDIFTSLQSSDGVWSKPVNLGPPLNTTDDDVFYVLSPDGLTAYFSSFREGGQGEKDNYTATFPNGIPKPLTLVKGVVYNQGGRPAENVTIKITDNETEQVVGIYRTNSKTGEFLFILTPDKNYNITYHSDNHLFYSENIDIPKKSNYYELKREILLDPIVVGSKIVLNNIFFEYDKATLQKSSNVELKNLVLLLQNNPFLQAEIAGHTDSKGSMKYNQKLSEKRAKAVVDYLVENGISRRRLKARGYGKSRPDVPNQTVDGKDDPEGRKLNRRVEMTVTEIESHSGEDMRKK